MLKLLDISKNKGLDSYNDQQKLTLEIYRPDEKSKKSSGKFELNLP